MSGYKSMLHKFNLKNSGANYFCFYEPVTIASFIRILYLEKKITIVFVFAECSPTLTLK